VFISRSYSSIPVPSRGTFLGKKVIGFPEKIPKEGVMPLSSSPLMPGHEPVRLNPTLRHSAAMKKDKSTSLMDWRMA
jgi:hypothetical protein